MVMETEQHLKLSLPRCVEFGREICGDLVQAERREWWLANGLGGYAAGTVAGSLTRRYHGLLVAPVRPSLGRVLLMAKADATLVAGKHQWPLFTNRWHGGAVDPEGNAYIESFYLDGRMPVWRFAAGPYRLEMRIWMEQGANTTYTAYRLETDPVLSPEGQALQVRLLINCRDHHGETDMEWLKPGMEGNGDRLQVAYPDGTVLHIMPCGGTVSMEQYLVENFNLPLETERGLPDRDSHLCAGHARLALHPGQWTGLVFSLDPDASPRLEEAMGRFRAHDADVLEMAITRAPEMSCAPDWVKQLVLAADSFVFRRPVTGFPEGESVIAGYPWFGDWGRDTMIALPGLALATGRYETARRILRTFARFIDRGMLPNVFPGAGETPEYNTVDAALWYIEAWRAYVEVTGDLDSLGESFPVLQDILESHRLGTCYGIRMDPHDNLLFAGEPGVQLTWMDAKAGETVFTPRIGKPVEINALWFNAHCAMAGFAEKLGMNGKTYRDLADGIGRGFQRFVNSTRGGLFDVLDGPDGNDGTIRPNQILAVSLTHSPIDQEMRKGVVTLCKRHLLCSFGLRSLTPHHPEYRPRYLGDVWERDSGYHQGPVWAWLLGHHALAEFRVHGDAAAAQALLEPVRHHLLDAGLGTVSEIFDGAPPHLPRGCPSQAWSVACILDAWWRLERKKKEFSIQDTE